MSRWRFGSISTKLIGQMWVAKSEYTSMELICSMWPYHLQGLQTNAGSLMSRPWQPCRAVMFLIQSSPMSIWQLRLSSEAGEFEMFCSLLATVGLIAQAVGLEDVRVVLGLSNWLEWTVKAVFRGSCPMDQSVLLVGQTARPATWWVETAQAVTTTILWSEDSA